MTSPEKISQDEPSVGGIIKTTREAKNLSQADLGKLIGVSQPTIEKIESGATRRSKFLPLIAAQLGLPLELLDPSLAAMNEARAGLAQPAHPPVLTVIPRDDLVGNDRDFAIHASAEGGPGQIIVSSDPIDYAARPEPLKHVRAAYGLLISNTSMVPEYRPGDTALVHPHLPVIADEVYIFYGEIDGEVRAAVKYLRRATPTDWHVTQWNPPPGEQRDFKLARKEWQQAHRVVGKFSRR